MTRINNETGRQVIITPNFLKHPEGSVLIETGDTKVICTASVQNRVSDWLRGKGKGWITAEYAMLPRANESRNNREGQFGKWPSSRSQEIQRLIARTLRASIWAARLGEITITIDCDVIQADGGTRTASITGGWVALALALEKLQAEGRIKKQPMKRQVAAISTGIVKGEVLLDLEYTEDSNADVDLNIAADENGNIIELQATGEKNVFKPAELFAMTELGLKGISSLHEIQKLTLESVGISMGSLLQSPEDL
ncbi:MAG: ribonuclease PH [Deltaproteobacteria bacterium]|nr:ribonuclease PH [Deltaproteobacteria bacterium]